MISSHEPVQKIFDQEAIDFDAPIADVQGELAADQTSGQAATDDQAPYEKMSMAEVAREYARAQFRHEDTQPIIAKVLSSRLDSLVDEMEQRSPAADESVTATRRSNLASIMWRERDDETDRLWAEFNAGMAALDPVAPEPHEQSEATQPTAPTLPLRVLQEPVPQEPTKKNLGERIRNMMNRARKAENQVKGVNAIRPRKVTKPEGEEGSKPKKPKSLPGDKHVFGQGAALRLMKEWEATEKYYDETGAEHGMERSFATLILGGLAVGGAAYLTFRGIDVFSNRARAQQAPVEPENTEAHDGQTQTLPARTARTQTLPARPQSTPRQTTRQSHSPAAEDHEYNHAQSNAWAGWHEGAIAAEQQRHERDVERLRDEDFDN